MACGPGTLPFPARACSSRRSAGSSASRSRRRACGSSSSSSRVHRLLAAMLGAFLTGLALGSLLLGPFLVRGPPARRSARCSSRQAPRSCSSSCSSQFEPWVRGVRGGFLRRQDLAAAQRLTALAARPRRSCCRALLGATFPWRSRGGAGARPDAVGAAAGRVHLWVRSAPWPACSRPRPRLLGASVPPVGPARGVGAARRLAIVVGAGTLLAPWRAGARGSFSAARRPRRLGFALHDRVTPEASSAQPRDAGPTAPVEHAPPPRGPRRRSDTASVIDAPAASASPTPTTSRLRPRVAPTPCACSGTCPCSAPRARRTCS
jgi:hypothetical protein